MFSWRYSRNLVFYGDSRVTILGNQLISGSRDPEINWLPGTNTRKSIDFRVLIPGNVWRNNFCEYSLKSGKNSTDLLSKTQQISGYCYPKINWFPGQDSRKLIDFRVLWPGDNLTSGSRYPEVKNIRYRDLEVGFRRKNSILLTAVPP